MKITVQKVHIKHSPALVNFAEKILKQRLSRFGSRIANSEVWFKDINGPKGGTDIQCTVAINRGRKFSAIAKVKNSDAYAAIEQAAKSVQRSLEKQGAKEQKARTLYAEQACRV